MPKFDCNFFWNEFKNYSQVFCRVKFLNKFKNAFFRFEIHEGEKWNIFSRRGIFSAKIFYSKKNYKQILKFLFTKNCILGFIANKHTPYLKST